MVNQLSPNVGGSEWEAASCNSQMGVLGDSSLLNATQLEAAEQAAEAHQLMKEMKHGYARPAVGPEDDGEINSKQQQYQQQQVQLMEQAQQAHQVMHAVRKGYQGQLDQQQLSQDQKRVHSGLSAAAVGSNHDVKSLAVLEAAGRGKNGLGVAERVERLIHGGYGAAGDERELGHRELQGISEDDAQLYGELSGWVRAGGGGLRGEAIMEKLLGELGAARAAAAAERGEVQGLRAALTELQGSSRAGQLEKVMLTQELKEVKGQLEVASKGLEEAIADRDLFLRRLQQLEEEGGEQQGGRRPTKLDVQRAKAHAAQVGYLMQQQTEQSDSRRSMETL
jgi:hypothetical protein